MVEAPIVDTLSTLISYQTQTNYSIFYVDLQLCYEHNDIKTI